MNTEKLDALASQAGFDVKRLRAPYPGGFPREDFLALEKFAELIVKECMNIVADAVNHREPASTYVGKIKEHFGVKY